MQEQFTVSLTLRDGYAFSAAFQGEPLAPLLVDERPPLGRDLGPNPARLLATAIGSCLGSSLLFCLRKARVEVTGLTVGVEVTLERNERGRLRIGAVRVRLAPDIPADQQERITRCVELFEDFCIVTQSVRDGIDVDVVVEGVPAAQQMRGS